MSIYDRFTKTTHYMNDEHFQRSQLEIVFLHLARWPSIKIVKISQRSNKFESDKLEATAKSWMRGNL